VASHVRDLLRRVERIEPFPAVAIRILELSLNGADAHEIGSIVEQDVGLTGKVLRLANSPMCGLSVEVESIPHATRLIGPRGVASLAMTTGYSSFLGNYGDSSHRSNEALRTESLHTALCARAIATTMPRTPGDVELVYTAALLQNLGHVLLDRFFGHELDTIHAMRDEGIDPLTAERETLGLDHARCAMLVGRRWGLPDRLVRAMLNHHSPESAGEDSALCQVLDVAEGVTWKEWAQRETSLTCPWSTASETLVERLGTQLDDLAEEVSRAVEEASAALR